MVYTITTKGVKGAESLLREFQQNIDKELTKVLPAYAEHTVSNMQSQSPVRTGYLRQSIRHHFAGPAALSINAWAPYAGFVNYGTFRMSPRPFFTAQVEQGPAILEKVFGQASINYLQQLIRKYQNGP